MSLEIQSLAGRPTSEQPQEIQTVLVKTPDGVFHIDASMLFNFFQTNLRERVEYLELGSEGPMYWPIPRKLTLSGAVAGEVTMDGSADVTMSVEIPAGSFPMTAVEGLSTELLNLRMDVDSKAPADHTHKTPIENVTGTTYADMPVGVSVSESDAFEFPVQYSAVLTLNSSANRVGQLAIGSQSDDMYFRGYRLGAWGPARRVWHSGNFDPHNWVGDVTLAGDFLPDVDNVRSLGSPDRVWRDVYIGPGSLYLNGQKVLEDTESGTIRVTADENQNIAVQTKGTGDVELNPLGTGLIQLKGPVVLQAGYPLRSSNGQAILVDDSITFSPGEGIKGGLLIDGSAAWHAANFNPAAYAALGSSARLANVMLGTGEAMLYESATNEVGVRTGQVGAYKYMHFYANGGFRAMTGTVTGTVLEADAVTSGLKVKIANKVGFYDNGIANTIDLLGLGDATQGLIRFGNSGKGFGWNGTALVFGTDVVYHAGNFNPSSKLDVGGTAFAASKLATARTFTLTGPVKAAAVSFDGQSNVTFNTVIDDAALSIAQVDGLQNELDAKLPLTMLGMAGGVPTLDENALIPAQYLPSYVDDVLEYGTLAVFPATGEGGKLYLALDTNMLYRWSGSTYVNITSGSGVSDSALKWENARTITLTGKAAGSVAIDGSADVNLNVTGLTVTKGDVGLENVDNTSDANKPVSTAQQAALDLKAPLTGVGAYGNWGIGITGNAATATKLATPRAVSLTGVVTAAGVDFDGSSAIQLSTEIADGALSIAKTSGLQAALDGTLRNQGSLAGTNLNTVITPGIYLMGAGNTNIPVGDVAGYTLTVLRPVGSTHVTHLMTRPGVSDMYIRSGNSSTGTFTTWELVWTSYNFNPGNYQLKDQPVTVATSADRWTTARTLSFTGVITGSMVVDGSQNVSMATTVADGSLSTAKVAGLDTALATLNSQVTKFWGTGTTAGAQPSNFAADANAITGATFLTAVYGSATNMPNEAGGNFALLTNGPTNAGQQFAMRNGEAWIRGQVSGTWSGWNKLWTSANFNPTTKMNVGTGGIGGNAVAGGTDWNGLSQTGFYRMVGGTTVTGAPVDGADHDMIHIQASGGDASQIAVTSANQMSFRCKDDGVNWTQWNTLYHSGNLSSIPAGSFTLSQTAGLQSALDAKVSTSLLGAGNGVATLDSNGKVPAFQLPSYVDDVLEYAALANFPVSGETGKIYVATGTNKVYRWSGSAYIEISASPGSTDAVAEGSTNLYFTNARAQAAMTGAASTIATSDLTVNRALVSDGSGKVAVSSATATQLGYLVGVTSAIQTQLDARVLATASNTVSTDLPSAYANNAVSTGTMTVGHPHTSGIGTVVTARSNSDNRVAQMAYEPAGGTDIPSAWVRTSHASNGGGGWTNWYKLWHSGNFDPATKANLASPAFTGTPTAPTAVAGTNTTQIATTAFVAASQASALVHKGLIPDAADLNTYTTTGLYHQNLNAQAATGTNYPTALAGMLRVYTIGSFTYQEYMCYSTNSLYRRGWYSNAWSPWYEMLDTRNTGGGFMDLGTNQQVNGVKTFNNTLNVVGAALGGTAGNSVEISNFRATSSNGHQLSTRLVRRFDGTNWTTAAMELRARVDSTDHAFIRFGGASGDTIYLGEGTNERHSFGPTNSVINGTVSFPGLIIAGNGNGTEGVRVGNDAGLWDVNIAHSIGLKSATDATRGYLYFGSDTNAFGYDGSKLFYNGNLSLGGAGLSFAAQTRQMINLWNTAYGIGVQNNTQYYRSGAGAFAWFYGGVHADTQWDPGTGGAMTMWLTQAGDLNVRSGNVMSAGAFFSSNGALSPQANPQTAAFRAQGNYGGGFGMTDGAYGISLHSTAGNLVFAFGSNTSVSPKAVINADGAGIFSRVFAGWDSGTNNAISCSNWFRTAGQTGIYFSDYGGGWHMTDTTYVRSYNGKAVAAADFVLTSDERLKAGIRPFEFRGRLRPVSYVMRKDGKPDFGFIAQEVEKLYPEAVGRIGKERIYQLSYPKLTAVLSHQVNELEDKVAVQDEQITKLKAKTATQGKRIKNLETENQEIKDRMSKLEALVQQLLDQQQ